MATTVITGRDVTFTLDSASYDAQATSATLSCETIIETYQTLDGRASGLFSGCSHKINLLRRDAFHRHAAWRIYLDSA